MITKRPKICYRKCIIVKNLMLNGIHMEMQCMAKYQVLILDYFYFLGCNIDCNLDLLFSFSHKRDNHYIHILM